MTRKKLTEAVASAAAECGFAFQTGFDYRLAPELKQLPAAWLYPPALTKTEGRGEGFKTYSVEMHLIEACGGSAAESKEERWGALETKAAEVCGLIRANSDIQVLSELELSPAELSLTARGELSLKLRFKVRMPFCDHCDGTV